MYAAGREAGVDAHTGLVHNACCQWSVSMGRTGWRGDDGLVIQSTMDAHMHPWLPDCGCGLGMLFETHH
jgi:hypothetical protein